LPKYFGTTIIEDISPNRKSGECHKKRKRLDAHFDPFSLIGELETGG
jgi:hypothetical protein